MSETPGCPPLPVHHVTSDVTAAFLGSTPGDKAVATERLGASYYARTDDVSGADVLLGATATGNDYFHQHRRHQFRRQDMGQVVPVQTQLAPSGDYSTGTCEHIYESPKHEGPMQNSTGSLTGPQPQDDSFSYYSQRDLRVGFP